MASTYSVIRGRKPTYSTSKSAAAGGHDSYATSSASKSGGGGGKAASGISFASLSASLSGGEGECGGNYKTSATSSAFKSGTGSGSGDGGYSPTKSLHVSPSGSTYLAHYTYSTDAPKVPTRTFGHGAISRSTPSSSLSAHSYSHPTPSSSAPGSHEDSFGDKGGFGGPADFGGYGAEECEDDYKEKKYEIKDKRIMMVNGLPSWMR